MFLWVACATWINKPFTGKLYKQIFSIRVNKLLQKLNRIEIIYKGEDVPRTFWNLLFNQRKRLRAAEDNHSTDIVQPDMFNDTV